MPGTRGGENLVRVEENDLFKAEIHEASVVTLFLLNSFVRSYYRN